MKSLVFIPNFETTKFPFYTAFSLSSERQTRADLLCTAREKQRFFIAERITVELLRHFFGVAHPEICGAVSEKPYVKAEKNVAFSRSYCDDALLIALEDAQCIGADAEKIRPLDAALMQYFFTEAEQNYVHTAKDADFAFTLIWTRKESYIKCIGSGLNFRFDLLDVTPREPFRNEKKLFLKNDKIGELYISSYRVGDTVLSICSTVNDDFPALIGGF